VSFQPEALTAALVVFCAVTTLLDGTWRIVGGLALAGAALSRYEAWAAALVFALLCFLDAGRPKPSEAPHSRPFPSPPSVPSPSGARPRAPLVAGVVALAAPLAWMLHGVLHHGDALFFLHRVAAYRRALGVSEPWPRALAAYPVALFRTEPEVVLAAGAVVWVAVRARTDIARLARPALVLGAVFAFLVVGRWLDGAPTHHEERTLLPIWTACALVAAEGLARAARSHALASAKVRGIVAVLLVTSFVVRATRSDEPGAPRTAERAIGDIARRAVPPGANVLVDTTDYGYFAVIAAFGAPERATPFDDHDPRAPRHQDAFASADSLRNRLLQSGASWLVVSRAHAPRVTEVARVVAEVPEFVLARIEGAPGDTALR
jgi:hypothetical protein